MLFFSNICSFLSPYFLFLCSKCYLQYSGTQQKSVHWQPEVTKTSETSRLTKRFGDHEDRWRDVSVSRAADCGDKWQSSFPPGLIRSNEQLQTLLEMKRKVITYVLLSHLCFQLLLQFWGHNSNCTWRIRASSVREGCTVSHFIILGNHVLPDHDNDLMWPVLVALHLKLN